MPGERLAACPSCPSAWPSLPKRARLPVKPAFCPSRNQSVGEGVHAWCLLACLCCYLDVPSVDRLSVRLGTNKLVGGGLRCCEVELVVACPSCQRHRCLPNNLPMPSFSSALSPSHVQVYRSCKYVRCLGLAWQVHRSAYNPTLGEHPFSAATSQSPPESRSGLSRCFAWKMAQPRIGSLKLILPGFQSAHVLRSARYGCP